MPDTRLYFQTEVLVDGRVYCSGGEYGTGGPRACIYDPQTNVWTALTIPGTLWNPSSNNFYDCNSEILSDGQVLLMPVFPFTSGTAMRYNPATNTWSTGGHLFRGTYQDEATWIKLPDNSILTIDPFGTNSERYIPSSNTWIDDGIVPVSLYDPFGSELGGASFLPNGKAFFLGSTGNTAFYTPSGSNTPGLWTAGPVIPGAHGTPDAPNAQMVDGKMLCAVSPIPTSANHFPPPTSFYTYDWVSNSFTSITGPAGASINEACYKSTMLCLPNGQVMLTHMATTVYVCTPAGPQLNANKPVITAITANGDGSFHLVGTGLNGTHEGASYGDDWQMFTNFPVIRINHSNGNVYYARTYNWSGRSILTGATPVTTEYRLPAGFPAGAYSLVVTANGVASDPASSANIGSGPDSVSACLGQSAQLTVNATGTGPLAYQWRRGTTNLVDGGNVSGSTTATLIINPVGPADLGNDYNVIVSNVLGSVTSGNATLSTCYANCDCSQTQPILNVNDFSCFLNRYAAGDTYANCDGSTTSPQLNVLDFSCFLNAFASGCP
jgi:hypothetical protein